MAVFDPKSRYVRYATTEPATDRKGRSVAALTPAEVPDQGELGQHRKKAHQRLDHLAHYYLEDAAAFWRIAEANGALLPDSLAEAERVIIPQRRGG
ncbi:MAG: hypothetical protein JOZ90_04185 [Alphaproteobacteria bacterium]|nr:hypothetical protein [Alphaproteobacteria bacterium]MBV9373191.1 hypothetical protein [Alphaproteobacteria bacterium]MBV9900280.1 hypothetical protein [Alphaproteobacteria bacterium]